MSSQLPSFSFNWRDAVVQLNQEVALFERNEKSSLLHSSHKGQFTRRQIIGQDSGMECLTQPPRLWVTFMYHYIHPEPSTGVTPLQDLAKTCNDRNKEWLVSSLLALQTLYQNTDNSAGSVLQCLCLLTFLKVQHREEKTCKPTLFSDLFWKAFILWKKSEMILRDWHLQN